MPELQQFFETWETEAQKTVQLLRALPEDAYDVRLYAEGRSLGELAWHLAESDAYMSLGLAEGFAFGMKPPGLERPRLIAALAPGYERVHREAVARLQKLTAEDLKRVIQFIDGRQLTVSAILWNAIIHHMIHHRGQLVLMTRIAGGTPPGMYGPTREEFAKMTEAMKTKG
jgi:uncharacterized damage-inducible protein DinB